LDHGNRFRRQRRGLSELDLTALEAELIRKALGIAAGNKSRAARLLGLTRDTLLYRIEKHLIKA
jgi:DNA-binding protein Fis